MPDLNPPWLQKLETFTKEDFRNETHRPTKIRMHMMDPYRNRLGKLDKRYLNILRQAFVIISDNYTAKAFLPLIRDLGHEHIGRRFGMNKASQILQDVYHVYGNAIKRNKDFDREMTIARLLECYEKLIEEKKWDKAADVMSIIGRFQLLDKAEDKEVNTKGLELPELQITGDVKALQQETIEEAQIDEEE